MPTPPQKSDVITFKVDPPLREALQGVANRSEFIRNAILAALGSVCPLCKGTGILTPDQRRHWRQFARDHALRQCDDCHAVHLVCAVHESDDHGDDPTLNPEHRKDLS
jgi:hypothetical protein